MTTGLYRYYEGLPTWARAIVIIALLLVIFLIINAINKAIKKARATKSFEQDYNTYCTTGKQSFPQETYMNLAGKIYESGNVFLSLGTDEEAIYDVFKQMKTDCDVILLARAFGKREPRGGICYSKIWGESCGEDLGVWLQTEISSGDFEKINKILEQKGLKSRF